MVKLMDLRYERTEKLLKQAALKLGEKKDIYSLTVTEICKEAMVSRIAFYDHYDNTTALIKSIEDEMLDRFIEEIRPFSDFLTAPERIIRRIVEYYKRNDAAIIMKGSASALYTKAGVDRIVQEIILASGNHSEEFEIRAVFLVTGILGVFEKKDITERKIISLISTFAEDILK